MNQTFAENVGLQASEEKFRSVIEQSADSIVLADENGVIIEWNRGSEHIFGLRADEVLGRKLWEIQFQSAPTELQTPAMQKRLEEALRNLFETHESPWLYQLRESEIQRPDGTRRFVQAMAFPIQSEHCFMIGSITRDITEQRQAEDALQRLVSGTSSLAGPGFFEALVKELAEWLGARWAIVGELTNFAPCKVKPLAFWADGELGYIDPYELRGTPCQKVTERGFCLFSEDLMDLFPEDEVLADMGVVWYAGIPLQDAEGNVVGVLNAFHDRVLEQPSNIEAVFSIFSHRAGVEIVRQRAELALTQYARQLEHSNAELERFAYITSHHMKEPLRMVSMYMQLLTQRYRGHLDADANEFITYAVRATKHMKQLLDDLLMYMRIDTQERALVTVDCNVVLAQTVAQLQDEIQASGASITHDPLPKVFADAEQLGYVFLHLLDNALKFRADTPPHIHVSAAWEEGVWRFTVTDSGIGIDLQYAKRIFEIFERLETQPRYQGTGIGLAICKKVIEFHGGDIGVESEPGQGSTFYFTIPDQNFRPVCTR